MKPKLKGVSRRVSTRVTVGGAIEIDIENQSIPGGGVLPENLGGGVRPASQNSYPIYDQNLRFSLPYL